MVARSAKLANNGFSARGLRFGVVRGWTALQGGIVFCPQCKAEYRQGFTHCADCDVDLVWELPKDALELRRIGENGEYRVAGEPGDPNEDPFCSFWKVMIREWTELCGVLDDVGTRQHRSAATICST